MFTVALVLVVLGSIPGGLSCVIDPQLSYGIVESMRQTDFIVYGQYQGVNNVTGHGMFMVYCMIKANGADMPENITIRFDPSACSATSMTPAASYILLLKTLSVGDRDSFLLAEPSKDTSAAFPATDQNLDLAANLCGLDGEGIKTPAEVSQTDERCPRRTATDEEDCVGEDPVDGAGRGRGEVLMVGVVAMLGALLWV